MFNANSKQTFQEIDNAQQHDESYKSSSPMNEKRYPYFNSGNGERPMSGNRNDMSNLGASRSFSASHYQTY